MTKREKVSYSRSSSDHLPKVEAGLDGFSVDFSTVGKTGELNDSEPSCDDHVKLNTKIGLGEER